MTTKTIAFITGANKGIGNEIARQLTQHDFTVLIGARDRERGEAAAEKLRTANSEVHFVSIDVNDTASIEFAAKTVAEKWGQVDVLINNAGVNYEFSSVIRPSMMDVDILKKTYLTNVFAPFSVIHHFVPLLKKSKSARIINVSSTLGSLTSLSDPENIYYGINTLAYNSSKTALNAITVSLANDLADDRISVNSVCPGWVKTEMGTDAAPRTIPEGAAIMVKLATMANPPTGKFLNDDGEVSW